MTTTERLTVTLPADIAAAVRKTVADGAYASPSAVIQDALESWVLRREEAGGDRDRLRAAVRLGIESGPAIPADAVLSELRARYAAKA